MRGTFYITSPFKLLHDADQLGLLVARGRIDASYQAMADSFIGVLDELIVLSGSSSSSSSGGDDSFIGATDVQEYITPFVLKPQHYEQIAPVYNVHLYVPPAPRLPALPAAASEQAEWEEERGGQQNVQDGFGAISPLLSGAAIEQV